MDAALRLVFAGAAVLPPPPEPEAATENGGLGRTLLVAAGLALAVLVAAGVGVLIGRARAARGRPLPAAFRVELWHNGEAVVLGYAGDPAAGDPTFASHLARLRAEGGRGALVLIEPVSDAIVTLRPIQEEEARPVPRTVAEGAGRAPIGRSRPEAWPGMNVRDASEQRGQP